MRGSTKAATLIQIDGSYSQWPYLWLYDWLNICHSYSHRHPHTHTQHSVTSVLSGRDSANRPAAGAFHGPARSIKTLTHGPVGAVLVIKYPTHTFTPASPRYTLPLCLRPDHKIIATDEGREQCFRAVCPVTDFHYKVCAVSLWDHWKKNRLQNAASQSPSTFSHLNGLSVKGGGEELCVSCWTRLRLARQWSWKADDNLRKCIQGSSCGGVLKLLEREKKMTAFIYSPFLVSFRHFWSFEWRSPRPPHNEFVALTLLL